MKKSIPPEGVLGGGPEAPVRAAGPGGPRIDVPAATWRRSRTGGGIITTFGSNSTQPWSVSGPGIVDMMLIDEVQVGNVAVPALVKEH